MKKSPFDDLRNLAGEPALFGQCTDPDSASIGDKADGSGGDQGSGLFLPKLIDSKGEIARILSFLQRHQKGELAQVDEVHLCLLASSYARATPVAALELFLKQSKAGAAPVNLLAQQHGLGLRVMDLAIQYPHEAFSWDEIKTGSAVAYGMEAVAAGGDILALGDTGFGNEAFALAVACAALRKSRDVDDILFASAKPIHNQISALLAGVPAGACPLEALKIIGGHDIAAAVGALLASRVVGMPLLIEGGAILAGVAVVKMLGASVDHIELACTRSSGEAALAKALGLRPILATDPGVGPGGGLALAHRILKAACDLQQLKVPNRLS